MIEIPDGWTATEANLQHDIGCVEHIILQLEAKLASAKAARAVFRGKCNHPHTQTIDQRLTCEICGVHLD